MMNKMFYGIFMGIGISLVAYFKLENGGGMATGGIHDKKEQSEKEFVRLMKQYEIKLWSLKR